MFLEKMTVLAIRRATQQVLHRLPSDLTPMIRGWIGGTRSDWRTCKQSEARIIKEHNEGIRRFVQELMTRRERRRQELGSPLSLSYHFKYQIYRHWLYQFLVMVLEWVRGN